MAANAFNKTVLDRSALRTETRDFLIVLDNHVTHLRKTAVAFSDPRHHPSYASYMSFRREVGSCIGFSTIIEHRLEQLGDDIEPSVIENYDHLVIDVWTALLDGARRYLETIGKKKELPLGSRGLYEIELKTLADARLSLDDNRYKDIVPAHVLENLKASEDLLDEILERAPDLQEFTDEPDPVEVEAEEGVDGYKVY